MALRCCRSIHRPESFDHDVVDHHHDDHDTAAGDAAARHTGVDPASTTADPRAHGDATTGSGWRAGSHLDALTPTAHRRSR